MNRPTSLYLDFVRFGAALTVFLSHTADWSFGGGLWRFRPYGSPAVIVFFVLSGFVISHVTDGREVTLREYGLARAARLYSVVVPVLFLSALVDGCGAAINPGLYGEKDVLGALLRLPVLLTFLHEAWGAHLVPGWNGAYWSLGYEVPYYILMAALLYGGGIARFGAVALIAAITGPRVLSLFPVWLMGFMTYRFCVRGHLSRVRAATCLLGAPLLALVWNHWSRGNGMIRSNVPIPEQGLDDLMECYGIAAMFCVHLTGFRFISGSFQSVPRGLERLIRWLAGATFTLYLFHGSLLMFARAILPAGRIENPWTVLPVVVAALGSIFIVAAYTERRKAVWHRVIARLVRPFAVS